MKFRKQIKLFKFLILAASSLWLCTAVAGGKPVKVEAVNPNVAPPDVTLEVVISGSGFNDGDTVEFFITESEDSEISVRGPAKSNGRGTTLTVDITVDPSAEDNLYDIVVTSSSNGRKGKGTTLFSVKKGVTPVVTLDITYDFGVLDSLGECDTPQCVTSTIRATGPVECGQNECSFTSNAEDADFALPSGFRDLMFATEWRRTPLNPDICFGSSEEDPIGIAELGTSSETGRDHNIVFLRRYNDGVTPWEASVGTFARDVDDLQDRQYIFNFEGCGTDSDCGVFDDGSMEGDYVGGELMRIDSHGNDRKFLSIPCRCTRSNNPDCPDDVPVPTPQIRITVVELPAAGQ